MNFEDHEVQRAAEILGTAFAFRESAEVSIFDVRGVLFAEVRLRYVNPGPRVEFYLSGSSEPSEICDVASAQQADVVRHVYERLQALRASRK